MRKDWILPKVFFETYVEDPDSRGETFLSANYQTAVYPKDGNSAEDLLNKLITDHYMRLYVESPAEDLTEKCRLLAAGRTDVEFSEYADYQLTELSKALNQYRKSVEQIAYFDPVYHIGNRMKYLKDVDMLISYDAKRYFRVYSMDIRSLANTMNYSAFQREMPC